MAVVASRVLREVDPRARLVHADPAIHIASKVAADRVAVERLRHSMFEAWDMIAGRRDAELGGSPEFLDIVGVNFYADNQWFHEGAKIAPGEPGYRPFRDILSEIHKRYGRPVIITETGSEGIEGVNWLRLIGGEINAAIVAGVPVAGCCVYPAMDYPGWADDRHCRCGPIAVDPDWTSRHLDPALKHAISEFRELVPIGSLVRNL